MLMPSMAMLYKATRARPKAAIPESGIKDAATAMKEIASMETGSFSSILPIRTFPKNVDDTPTARPGKKPKAAEARMVESFTSSKFTGKDT